MFSFIALQNELETQIRAACSLSSAAYHAAGATVTLITDRRRAQHGDIACNAAMVLARTLQKSPQTIAQTIVPFLEKSEFLRTVVSDIQVIMPGFINLTLKPTAWHAACQAITDGKENFFKQEAAPQLKKSYLVEFVSANPTGPLHLGHGRNAIIGDALCRVLSFIGHTVQREFYINDAGSQMAKMGRSVQIRALQALGDTIDMIEDGYHGAYITQLAQEILAQHGDTARTYDLSFFTDYALTKIAEQQKHDLAAYGVVFDRWFSEKSLHDSGAIEQALATLAEKKLLYTQDGALWFRATQFGDDKDRVLRKADGALTYIAPDIAYHVDKFNRVGKNGILINILGQDHHGYVLRLKGTLEALGYDRDALTVILYQLVSIKKDSIPVKMSKRAGNFTTINDVVQTIGVDAARYFFLAKKAEAHLELDINVALQKNSDNPVFYIQYAYVRTVSILHKAAHLSDANQAACYEYTAEEKLLIKKAIGLADTLTNIGATQQTHNLAQYTFELAQLFHTFYTNNKVIDEHEPAQTAGRLKLIHTIHTTLGVALDLLGLSRPTNM